MKRILPLFLLPLLAGCSSNAASIGIIGGADGPTAILVSGPSAVWIVLPLAILALLAVCIGIAKKRKH